MQQGWLPLYALHSAKSDDGPGSGARMIKETKGKKKAKSKGKREMKRAKNRGIGGHYAVAKHFAELVSANANGEESHPPPQDLWPAWSDQGGRFTWVPGEVCFDATRAN